MKRKLFYTLAVVLFNLLLAAEQAIAYRADARGPVRGSRTLDDADPNATHTLCAHDVGALRTTFSNWGEQGNADIVPGYRGFEYPRGSGNDFLFSAGIWIGAQVNGQVRVTTSTDGDNGTQEFWPVHIGTIPASNESEGFADWHLSSSSTARAGELDYVFGRRGADDDDDWNLSADDLNFNGVPDANYDGGAGWLERDDDGDGVYDEEVANGVDDDGDGRVDEDTNASSDANGDRICHYDPEPHVDEDPAGDVSADRLDNDYDGLVDGFDSDFDGDQMVGALDDDGDGVVDEDGAASAYQEFVAAYQDSISPQFVRSPSGPHLPLQIEVVQHSRAFAGEIVGKFVLCDYVVRNRGAERMDDIFISLFADPDLVAQGESGDAGSLDDWNYFVPEHMMAVQEDDSSDADGYGPGLFAMKVIRLPNSLSTPRFSFQNFDRTSGGDPWLDFDKYTMMTSGEIAPPSYELGDWRLLMSFGANEQSGYTLQPNEELSFAVAYIGADDRWELADVADLAEATYYSSSVLQAPSPPRNLQLQATAPGLVTLSWRPPYYLDATVGYRASGIANGGHGQIVEYEHLWEDTVLTIQGLVNGSDWLFQVVSVDTADNVSLPAELLVRVNAPRPIVGINATNQAGDILVTWQPAPEPNIVGYRILRTQQWPDWSDSVLFTASDTDFLDETAILGRDYAYQVAATNSDNISGMWSATAVVTAWGPTRPLLVYDDNRARPGSSGGVPLDSLRENLQRILVATGIQYDYCQDLEYATIDSLAHYERVLWISENRSPVPNSGIEDVLQQYLRSGGKLVRFARRFLVGHLGLQAGLHEGTPEALEPLQLEYALASTWRSASPGMQFVGATPTRAGFPAISLNTNRLDSLHFNENYYDYLPEIDVFWTRGNTHELYRTQVLPSDSSGIVNEACAVYTARYIVVAFPLYFLPEAQGRDLVRACLLALDTIQTAVDNSQESPDLPRSIALHPCYPNPFNYTTTLSFDLFRTSDVALHIYNILGQHVTTLVNEPMAAGFHKIQWDASASASGLYLARLEAAGQIASTKLLLIK